MVYPYVKSKKNLIKPRHHNTYSKKYIKHNHEILHKCNQYNSFIFSLYSMKLHPIIFKLIEFNNVIFSNKITHNKIHQKIIFLKFR